MSKHEYKEILSMVEQIMSLKPNRRNILPTIEEVNFKLRFINGKVAIHSLDFPLVPYLTTENLTEVHRLLLDINNNNKT